MIFLHHPTMVKTLVKSGEQLKAEVEPHEMHLLHMVLGISGEAGELLDAVKKSVMYRKLLDRANVIEELGDIEFYLEGLRQALNIDRQTCIEHNLRKLSARYPNGGFSNRDAIERKDKQQ
jgi:NTP pyrophosphatase (non-canonical NTP hydrolase)